jgi:hypothetical protein
MANSKISALTAITGANVDTANDVFPIVDTSATQTKKILVVELGYSLLAVRMIAKSAAAVSVPADTTEDTLATITVPANAMGANGALRITTMWSFTNSGNNKTIRARFSGGAGTQYMNIVFAANANFMDQRTISNRNATNSQVGYVAAAAPFGGATTGGIVTSAVDTTASTTVVITGQKASSGETLTLEMYLVELLTDGT